MSDSMTDLRAAIAQFAGYCDTHAADQCLSADTLRAAMRDLARAMRTAAAERAAAQPVAWMKSPHGAIHANSAYRWTAPQSVTWSIPLYPAPPAPASEPQAAAARDVLAERARQVSQEGWTPEHDDQHDGMELAFAASCYAVADEGEPPNAVWPWPIEWWKPRSHRENLVRAGALILAEIERLDRAARIEESK